MGRNFSPLAEKERAQYNEGLERDAYNLFFSHCRHFYTQRRNELVKERVQFAQGKNVLEIGSAAWRNWLEPNTIIPASLTCINISEVELKKGADFAAKSKSNPRLILMDAHNLEFADGAFDFVFGDGILHHLDIVSALEEICRVLKPDGRILFLEPLDMNPVGKIVRALTKKARTTDEQPIRRQDIVEIKKHFETHLFYEEFLSVPFGVLSRMVFADGSNALMQFAFNADLFIDRNCKWIRNWFRYALIDGIRH